MVLRAQKKLETQWRTHKQFWYDFIIGNKKFEYPMIPGLKADSRLPELSELKTPEVDLIQFASQDINATIALQEEAGVL